MARFTQMMDVIFGLTRWVDLTNEWNGLNEKEEVESRKLPENEDLPPIIE